MINSSQAAATLTALAIAIGCFISVSSNLPIEMPAMGVEMGTNPTHSPFPYPRSADIPIEYTYGLRDDLNAAATEWGQNRGTPLLQPTWLPEGMRQTSVYVQRSNVSTHTGIITMVTTTYSYGWINNLYTAEVVLIAQMEWDMPWMVPSPGKKIGIEGNYTVIGGNPAYVGVIGWGNEDYYEWYGGTARVVSVQKGAVLYFLRAPENFPSSDLVKIAGSLKPIP
jgi:hypothetical protein